MMRHLQISMFLLCLFGSMQFIFGEDNIHGDQQFSKENVHHLDNRAFIRNWFVVDPIPTPPSDANLPRGNFYYGFYTDYLKSIGGESHAVFYDEQIISVQDPHLDATQFKVKHITGGHDGIVNFDDVYGRKENQVVYAFCYINSELDQEGYFLFGSDDAAKVWINGKLVHQIYEQRGVSYANDKFSAHLKKGYNSVLIKIIQGVREWGFVIEALDEEGSALAKAKERYILDFDAFLKSGLQLKAINRWNYVFGPGELPELAWEKPYLVEKIFGEFPLKVRWFDKHLNEVQKADNPGRFAYVADGMTSEGIHIRRAGTVFCMDWDWMAWAEKPKAYLDHLTVPSINPTVWEKRKEPIADFAGRMVLLSMLDQKEGAILLSYLDEAGDGGDENDLLMTPVIHEHDFHLALKRKILNLENKWPPLRKPTINKDKPAVTLHEGSVQEAGILKGTCDRIRNICREWAEKSGEPFSIFIARHGKIIIHEAFGEGPQGKTTLKTATEIASVTKLLTGVLFAQFVDQGLIGIDDPVGKYLPDFPVKGDKSVTLRQCFTHTTGLWGHEEWGGIHDPWMDNKIANILNELPVGKKHEYNGMGYNLAGKVMEIVSGKSIFRLFREHFFDPLGLDNSILEEDLGFSCHTTAGDLAVIGQLLLNRGSYGDVTFFSPETFDKLLPEPLNKYYPDIHNTEWGIGITWMRQAHPDAGKDGKPNDLTILSKNVIGHGSATSAILRIDLDNDLVISQTRRRGGPFYEQYLERLLMAVDEGLIN